MWESLKDGGVCDPLGILLLFVVPTANYPQSGSTFS
jgi:hypothetical protein